MSVNMGLQLFPPPPSKRQRHFSRKLSVRRTEGQLPPRSASAMSMAREPEAFEGRPTALSRPMSAMDDRPPVGEAQAVSTIDMPRSQTGPSNVGPPTRRDSVASHSSIAKPRLTDPSARDSRSNTEQPMIRSIFPRYDPHRPLERQSYYPPAQASPTNIPKEQISRAPYSPGMDSLIGSPMSAPPTVGRFPKSIQDVPKIPKPATTEELKDLWKVTNGWRVSASEGRSFVLKLTSSVDAPVHTLSSATQPFYTFKLDPTSTSALVTMTRQDPFKRASSSPKAGGNEVLTTMLEELTRRLPPNDGLVAQLCPTAATTMAMDLASKPNPPDEDTIVEAAERECARLVWDDDSKTYYLVHPALSVPFRFVITTLPAWSRVEYNLEHPELPKNLVKLVRDGAGGGFLEVDTGIAALVDSFYLMDVAVCAILLVAMSEEKTKNIERFEAPPMIFPTKPKSVATKSVKIQEMEIDLESQSSMSDKKQSSIRQEISKLPLPVRAVVKLLEVMFKLLIWSLTLVVNIGAKILVCILR